MSNQETLLALLSDKPKSHNADSAYKHEQPPKEGFGLCHHDPRWAAYSAPHKMVRIFDSKLSAIRQVRRFEMIADNNLATLEDGGRDIEWDKYWVGR